MKAKLLTLLILLFSLSACGGGNLQIEGKVQYIDYLSYKCWYVYDTNTGYQYELVSSDDFLLQEGLKVKIVAQPASTETICNVGEKVNVISYKVTSSLENGKPYKK